MAEPLAIEFVADIVCPWCYLGKARLDKALAETGDVATSVHWRPYLLNPEMPREGRPYEEHLARVFGSAEAYRERSRPFRAQAEAEGLAYRPELIAREPNTIDGHRLIGWAGDRGWAMAQRLMELRFAEGGDLTDRDVLAEAAGTVGLDPAEIRRRLDSDDGEAEVAWAAQNAQARGVTGVPMFIFAGTYGASGAQPSELLARAIHEIAAKTAEAAPQ